MKTYGENLYLQIYKANCIIKDLEKLQCAEFDKETRNDMLQRVVIRGESLANNLRQMLLQYSVVTPEFYKEQISRRKPKTTVDAKPTIEAVDLNDLFKK